MARIGEDFDKEKKVNDEPLHCFLIEYDWWRNRSCSVKSIAKEHPNENYEHQLSFLVDTEEACVNNPRPACNREFA